MASSRQSTGSSRPRQVAAFSWDQEPVPDTQWERMSGTRGAPAPYRVIPLNCPQLSLVRAEVVLHPPRHHLHRRGPAPARCHSPTRGAKSGRSPGSFRLPPTGLLMSPPPRCCRPTPLAPLAMTINITADSTTIRRTIFPLIKPTGRGPMATTPPRQSNHSYLSPGSRTGQAASENAVTRLPRSSPTGSPGRAGGSVAKDGSDLPGLGSTPWGHEPLGRGTPNRSIISCSG